MMRPILTVGLLMAVLLAACGRSAPSQPAMEGQAPPVVTIFKAPT